MVILVLGLLSTLIGLIFLVGCFVRVDSAAFIHRASDDAAKIAKLHSLQDAWDRLGKFKQFLASASAYLIMGVGLLVLYFEPRAHQFWWVVPLILVANLFGLMRAKRQSQAVLDPTLTGHAEVLQVIKRQLRMCITFCVVFAILALGV